MKVEEVHSKKQKNEDIIARSRYIQQMDGEVFSCTQPTDAGAPAHHFFFRTRIISIFGQMCDMLKIACAGLRE